MMLFNKLLRGLLLQMNTYPINLSNNDTNYDPLEAHQRKYDKGNETEKDPSVFIAEGMEAFQ